jgi:hypothetical protein
VGNISPRVTQKYSSIVRFIGGIKVQLNSINLKGNKLKVFTKNSAVMLLIATFATAAFATVEEGEAAYRKQDFATAFKEFKAGAEKGEAAGMYDLAALYNKGEGVSQDDAESSKWYLKAAEKGHISAVNVMGERYLLGKGVKQDTGEGIKWLKKAAAQDHSGAQNTLGSIYYFGDYGIAVDKAEAVKWFRMSAERNHPDSQFNLGLMLHLGDGVKKNDEESKFWLQHAAAQGNQNAQNALKKSF